MKSLFTKLNRIQDQAVKAILPRLLDGENALMVLPTGEGKTHAAIKTIRRFLKNKPKARVLWLSNRNEILEKSLESFKRLLPGIEVGRFDSTSRDVHSQVIMASIDTIKFKYNLRKFSRDDFDVVIYDEAHHASAPSWERVIKYFKGSRLGMTATPVRMDQKRIEDYFGEPVVHRTISQAKAEGTVAHDESWIILTNSVLRPMVSKNEEYSPKELDRLYVSKDRNKIIVQATQEYGKDRCKALGLKFKAICFCRNQLHAKRMAKMFNRAGFTAAYMVGSTVYQTKSNRSHVWNKFKSTDDIEIMCNVDVIGEGIDVPDVTCLIMARPTRSSKTYLQQFGRGTRRMTKDTFVVLDFVDNCRREWLPYTAGTALGRSIPRERVVPKYVTEKDPVVLHKRVDDAVRSAEKFQSNVTIDPSKSKFELENNYYQYGKRPLKRSLLGMRESSYHRKDHQSFDSIWSNKMRKKYPLAFMNSRLDVGYRNFLTKIPKNVKWAEGQTWRGVHVKYLFIDSKYGKFKKSPALLYESWIRGSTGHPKSRGDLVRARCSKQVINLDTGDLFNNSNTAALQMKCTSGNIKAAIYSSGKAGGYRWAYYDPKKHAHLVKKNSKKAA